MRELKRRVLFLSAPLALSAVLTPLITLVETGIAGHLPGAHTMAAVALGGMIFNFMFWAFAFLRLGTTGLTAQAFGERNHDELRLTLLRGLVLALVFGVAVIAIGQGLLGLALSSVNASPEAERLAAEYVRTRLLGVPAAFASYVLLGFVMGLAETRLTMVLETLRGLTSLGMLALLVGAAGGSVRTIALASVAAEWLSALLSLTVVLRIVRGLPGQRPSLSQVLEGKAITRLLILNSDLFVRTQCLLLVLAVFTAAGAQLGDEVLATNSALINTYWLFTYAISAFAMVGSSLVGQAVGARDHAALLSALRLTTVFAIVASAVATIVLAVWGERIVGVLTESDAVRGLAHTYVPYIAALPLVAVLSLQLDGIAVGAGQLTLLRNTFLVSAALSLLLQWATTPVLGNHGVWIGFVAFMGLRSVGFFWSYRRLTLALPPPMMKTKSVA